MRPGDLVAGRFEVEAFVGEGGMGAVYRAIDRQSGEPVALKHVHAAGDGEARFFREARALAMLSHPAIVRYVAHGSVENAALYLAMEWLEGETLRNRLEHGPLTVEESVEVARRVLGALSHAHAQGVVHRDLNPSNLLLVGGRVESIKVLDFGLARLRGDRTETSTHWDAPMGTVGYMAPEQARGAGEADARADLFSLGCVLFECLTGQPAFGADNYLAVLAKIVVASAPRVRELAPKVPLALDLLVDQLLKKDADDRPPHAEAVIEALNALGGSRPSLRTPLSGEYRALTGRERALVSVIVARSKSGSTAERLERAKRVGADYGVNADRLADGSLILIASASGAATDQAARVARCALALRDALAPAELGFATGWALVAGALPSGDLVDRAITLLGSTESGTLRIDDATAGLLPPRFEVSGDATSLTLRGEREDTRPLRLLMGRDTPCVGRERELRTLFALVDESVGAPMAHAILLTGAAGVGKSRVRYELLRQLPERHAGIQVWVGRGDPMRAGSPFFILAQALRNALGISESETEALQMRKLVARASRHTGDSDGLRIAEFLGELLGLSLPDADSPRLRAARQDPILMGDQIRQALEDLLRGECRMQPVLLVLEDFQWGDAATVKLVDGALRNLSESPLVILALARPEVHDLFPGLWADRALQELKIGALTRRAAETLVRELLPGAEAGIVANVVARAGGNAFYLEEMIRAHAEGRGDRLPDTVLGMVKERIESMEPEARRVLRAASVFGQSFWPGGAAALLGGDEMSREVAAWLGTLEQREVVSKRSESAVPGEAEYTFRHSLVRDAAYAMLTDEDRHLGHRLAAEWLEERGKRDGVLLAEHYERAGAPESALAWWYEAARDALEANDFDAAVNRARRGLESATGTRAAELELVQAEALRLRGDVTEAVLAVERSLAGHARGSLGWCNAMGERAVELQRLGRGGELLRASDELSEVESTPEAVDSLAMARVRTALALLRLGARERADKLIALVETPGGMPGLVTLAWTHAFHAVRALLDGDPSGFLRHARVALAHHDEIGDVRPALETRISIGSMYFELGAYAEAEQLLTDARSQASRLGLAHALAGAEHNLGLAVAHLGRSELGIELELRALEAFRGQDRRMQGGAELALAMIRALCGDLELASEEAERALLTLREAAPPLVPAALATLAGIRHAQGRDADALGASSEAHAALSAGGVEYGEHLIRRVHAEVLVALGRADEARGLLEKGRARLLEEAAKLDDPELRRGFLERVPDNARLLSLALEHLG